MDARRKFAYQLCPDNRGDPANVTARVVFDNIGTDNGRGLTMQASQQFAHAQPAGFGMGDARGFGWVDAIKVNRNIKRAGEYGDKVRGEAGHWQNIHPETIRLFLAVPGHGADADLDQLTHMARFTQAGKGGGVTARIAFEIIIKIGVRIKMQYVDRAKMQRGGLNQREGHTMVPAQREWDF